MTRKLLFPVFIFFCLSAFGQNSPEKGYVRIKIASELSQEQQVAVNDFISSQAGVIVSRTDRYSSVYFAQYELASGLTVTNFENWLQAQGVEISCSVSGPVNGEPLAVFPEDCGKRPLEQEEMNR